MAKTQVIRRDIPSKLKKAQPAKLSKRKSPLPQKLVVANKKSTDSKLTKSKAISKKRQVSKLSDEEKALRAREREQKRLVREAKQKIAAEKKAIKLEKLRMWEVNENKSIPKLADNFIICTNDQKLKSSSHDKSFQLNQCCLFCNNRLVYYHASRGNVAEFKKALRNYEQLSNVHQDFSINYDKKLLDIIMENKTASDNLLKAYFDFIIMELKDNKEANTTRTALPMVSLSTQGTGYKNKYMFKFATRKVQLSRGGKEGNNAFTHDNKMRKRQQLEASEIVNRGTLPVSIIKYMRTLKISSNNHFIDDSDIQDRWVKAARKGNFELVKYIFNEMNKKNDYLYLTKLAAASVLQGDDAKNIRLLSRNALTKHINNDDSAILPAHIACINPDIHVLKTFFRVYPNGLQTDAKNRDLGHYAAVAKTSDALEFLIQRNHMINNGDDNMITPLMLACKNGRTQNVGLILQEQEKQLNLLDSTDEDHESYLSFHQYMNSEDQLSNTPLHYACCKGHLAIVKLLIEAGALLDKKNRNQDTPLTFACQNGHLKIADLLIDQGANIHGVDRQHRSPFIRACQNGQLHIVALLLRKGVCPNFSDSSGNTGLHYAAAYGWLEVVKFLVEHGKADANRVNEWKSSPAFIAMLKGHFGIVDFLLDHSSGSLIDDQGRTLIAQLCMNINEDSSKNLGFLLKKQKIDVTIKDANGFNALHHLASNDIHEATRQSLIQQNEGSEEQTFFWRRGKKVARRRNNNSYNSSSDMPHYYPDDQKAFDKLNKNLLQEQVKCAQLLLQAGISPLDETNEESEFQTALYCAVTTKSLPLAELLFKTEPRAIIDKVKKPHANILHQIAENWLFQDTTNLLQKLVRNSVSRNELRRLAQEKDFSGRNPFIYYFDNFKNDYSFIFEDEDQCKFAIQRYLKNYYKHIKSVVDIYVNDLGFDVTTQVGLSKPQIETLEEYLKEGNINQKTFNQIINLRYEEEEKQKNSKKKDSFKIDEIEKFDKKMKLMGLLFKPEEPMTKTVARKNRRRFYRRNYHYDSDDESEEESTDNEEWELVISDFYNGQVKRTSVVFLQMALNSFKQARKECYWCNDSNSSFSYGESTKKLQKEIEDIIIYLINLSKDHLKQKSKKKDDDIQYQGFNKFDSDNKNPIILALEYNQLSLLQKIAETNLVALDISQKQTNLSALHYAATKLYSQDQIDEFFKVSAKKINFNALDKNENSCLHYAAFARNVDFVRTLLASKQFDINRANKYGYTPTHMSMFAFDESKDHTPGLEKLLLSQDNVDINQLDKDNRSPLFYLFFKHRQFEENQEGSDPVNVLMVVLSTSKTPLNLRLADKNKNTILHYACMRGSTICALTLMAQDINMLSKAENLLGNTPFAEAMRFNQHQLCTFLVQNGTGNNQMINFPELSEKNESIEEACEYLLDEKSYNQIKKSIKYKDQKSYIERMYKMKQKSAFEISIGNNWNGISYLLFAKKFDQLEALASCLRAGKLDSFLDFLDNVQSKEAQRLDAKGNNLILILVNYLAGACNNNDEEEDDLLLKKSLKVIEKLRNKPYKLDLMHQNNKGKNILHIAAGKNFNNLWLLDQLTTIFKKESEQLLKAKDNRFKSSPLVMYFFKLDDISYTDQLIKFLQKFKLQQMDLTFIWDINSSSKTSKTQLIPYLNDHVECYLNPSIYKPVKTHLIHEITKCQDDPSDYELFIDFMKILKPFFNTKKQNGQTPIIQMTINRKVTAFFKYMLGWKYDKKENELVESYKDKQVDLDLQDNLGRTALHWAICPIITDKSNKNQHVGSWQDQKIVELLLKAGANPNIKDNHGKTCIDYATNSPSIMAHLEKACKKKANKSASSSKVVQLKQDQILDELSCFTDQKYEDDADRFIKKRLAELEDKRMQIDSDDKFKPAVKIESNAQVNKDACAVAMVPKEQHKMDGDLYYDIGLIKVDVKKTFYGIHVFYVMQLIYDKVKDMHVLFTRWGRIGSIGQYQLTPFPSLLEADAEFKKVFRQKTGNAWQNIHEFAYVNQKYKLRRLSGKTVFQTKNIIHWQVAERDVDMSKLFINFKDYKLPKSKLSEDQMKFIEPLVDSAAFARTLNQQNEQEKDIFWECLLDKKIFKRLTEVLIQIGKSIKNSEKQQKVRNICLYTKAMENSFDLMNEFYELSTPRKFAFNKVEIFYSYSTIMDKLKEITQLYDVEHASKLIFAASNNIQKINPYDYCYNMLNCKLSPLDTSSKTWSNLMFYINNSAKNMFTDYVVQNIFGVNSANQGLSNTKQAQKEHDNVFDSLHNHFMLFHGSTQANLLSIIEQGLQVSPQNGYRQHGQAWGAGIYLADNFNFAAQYSDSNQDTWYVLVVEAALGNVHNCLFGEHTTEVSNYSGLNMHKGYHSTRIMGREGPDLNFNWVTPEGQIWPLGKNIDYPKPEFRFNNKLYSHYQKVPNKIQLRKDLKNTNCSLNNHWFSANEVEYFDIQEYFNNSYYGGLFRYGSDYSQYIVKNSSQVRVKYVIQMHKKDSHH